MNRVFFGEIKTGVLLGGVQFTNLFYLLPRELRFPMIFAMPIIAEHLNGMMYIFSRCNVFKVLRNVQYPVSVFMVNMFSWWTRAYECFCNDAVNTPGLFTTAIIKHNKTIAMTIHSWAQYPFRVFAEKSFNSSRNKALHAFDLTIAGDSVLIFKTYHGTPFCFHVYNYGAQRSMLQ